MTLFQRGYEDVQIDGYPGERELGITTSRWFRRNQSRGWYLRMLHIGSASAFQAEGVSSILIIRSRKKVNTPVLSWT